MTWMDCAREAYGRHARLAVGALIILCSIEVAIILGLAVKAARDFGHAVLGA